ncbi:hypothetical protein V501_06073, partial [Pseudogymnoascus sp. VKM F-4519 (FW-2642)]
MVGVVEFGRADKLDRFVPFGFRRRWGKLGTILALAGPYHHWLIAVARYCPRVASCNLRRYCAVHDDRNTTTKAFLHPELRYTYIPVPYRLPTVAMSQFSAAVTPGRSLGFLALGSSLHDIVTRLKAEPQTFGKLELIYSPDHPVTEPVIVSLPTNGLRLRFDGPEQRLRLIEITDFSKSKLTYKNIDIVKPASPASPSNTSSSIPDSSSAGPTFKHIYNKLLAPSYPGDYVPPDANGDGKYGVYILSYPGIAFTFPVLASTWNPSKDYATMLALPSTKPATSMAVFIGDSWVEAQKVLYDELLEDPRSYSPSHKGKDVYPDEISLVNIFGEGKLRLDRAWGSTPFWLFLGQTTPQELVAELGPPDAIYRKSDQRMAIHKARAGSESQQTRPHLEPPGQDDSTDTDASSIRTGTSVSGDESDSGSID